MLPLILVMENDMTPLKEIGECVIGDGVNEFFFRPSFRNMSRIGSPEEIVHAFYDLHNDEASLLLQRAIDAYGIVPDWLTRHISATKFSKRALMAAHSVLTACCDDDISSLVGWLSPGKSGRWGFVWHKGSMPEPAMIYVAQSLITHGIIGKAFVRKLQRHESSETTSQFHATEYIMAARNHFGISRDEAENLTMTEFAMMLKAKYPEQKGLTRDEYDAVMDEDERRWQELISREQSAKRNS